MPDITPSPLSQVSQAKSTSKICSEKLSSDFNFLLETGSFSDVTMKCEGVELSCHKLILGARYELWKYLNKTFCHSVPRSPVFNAMFMHNMTENQEKKIDIEDLDIETVKDMLK